MTNYNASKTSIMKQKFLNLHNNCKSNKGDISIRDGLLMLDAKRIILPKQAKKPIMERLHIGHAGQEKTTTLLLARNVQRHKDN